MLKSPYKHLGENRQTLPCRVDPVDAAYLRSKFPYGLTGLYDVVLSTLFNKFINELRKREPFDPACFVNDPGYSILADVLDSVFVGRRTVGGRDSTEEVGSRNERRGASGIRETVQRSTKQRTNTTGIRKGRPKAKDSEGAEEV